MDVISNGESKGPVNMTVKQLLIEGVRVTGWPSCAELDDGLSPALPLPSCSISMHHGGKGQFHDRNVQTEFSGCTGKRGTVISDVARVLIVLL